MRLSTEADKRGRSISLVTMERVASLRRLLSFFFDHVETLGSRAKEIRSKRHTFWLNLRDGRGGSKARGKNVHRGLRMAVAITPLKGGDDKSS